MGDTQLGCIHHIPEFHLIHGGKNGHIGNAPQVSDIVNPMVCCAVFSYQSGPVKTENHRQVLQAHIVDNLVVGPLQESGIHVAKRNEA